MRIVGLIVCAALPFPAVASTVLPSDAVPRALATAGTFGNPDSFVQERDDQTTSANSFAESTSAGFETEATSRADIASGELGVATAARMAPNAVFSAANAEALLDDFVVFDQNATIEWQIRVDGSLFYTGDSSSTISSNVIWTDVSGVDRIYTDSGDYTSAGTQVSFGSFLATTDADSFTCTEFDPPPTTTVQCLTEDGVAQSIDATVTGVLEAIGGVPYFLQMSSVAGSGDREGTQGTFASFLGTSTFSFLDLDGAQAQSLSGVLPGTTLLERPTTVIPLPASFWLLGGALLLLVRLPRRARERIMAA